MKKAFLFLLIALCVCKTTGSLAQVLASDSLALVDFYDSTGGANWTNNAGWLDGPIIYWHGITLDGTGKRVAGISLGSNNLTGSLPSSLGSLGFLTSLELSSNQLSGNIPSSIGGLTGLTYLALSGNQLSGSIPSSIGNLNKLVWLLLSSNQLSGSIPPSIGNLTVYNLDFSYNQLTGSIPSSLGNMPDPGTGPNIQNLDLSYNKLTDTIPSSFGNLVNLEYLSLSNNQLTGSIPSTLGIHIDGDVVTFDLNNNQLTGSIPSSLAYIHTLYLSNNQLTGSLPVMQNNTLDLSYNQLTDMGQFANTPIQNLYLNNNQLAGSIPSTIGNLTGLQLLDLSNNQLSGSIPSVLSALSSLQTLNLSNNQLSGTIPTINLNTATNPSLALGTNQFTFNRMEDIAEYNTNGPLVATYAPQAYIPLHYNAGQYSVSAGGTLSNNTYNWYKEGTLVAAIVGDSTYTPSGGGKYSVAVTNSIVTNPTFVGTDLVLYSDSILAGIDSLNIMPDHPLVEYANRQNINANGWTDYYWDNNTPNDYTDDTLLLSLNTNGQNIGSIGDGTFAVKLAATAGAGSDMGIELTNPLITNPSGFWVMNRYWLVMPTTEPMANVGVRFYYNNQDLADVNGSYPTHNLTNQQLIFYKAIGGNPDPTTNLAGATGIISILNSTYASDTTWTYHQLTDTTQYAEFSVASFSGGGGGGTGNDEALPIKLLNFTATKEGNRNLLQWTTANEVNSSYFNVERSSDGASFTGIGQVNAVGNSSVAKNYSLVDAKPVNGMNYYRLKMMDKDGQFSYSLIRTINETVSFVASIYPNPVKNKLNLNFNSDKAMMVEVVVVDNEGKMVGSQQVQIAAGVSIQSINVGALSSGVYYVRVVNSDGGTGLKFVKE